MRLIGKDGRGKEDWEGGRKEEEIEGLRIGRWKRIEEGKKKGR